MRLQLTKYTVEQQYINMLIENKAYDQNANSNIFDYDYDKDYTKNKRKRRQNHAYKDIKMINKIPENYLPNIAAITLICFTSTATVCRNCAVSSLTFLSIFFKCIMILLIRTTKYNASRI